MAGKKFELTEDTLSVIEEIGGHMPGGFFIYKAEKRRGAGALETSETGNDQSRCVYSPV